MHAYKGFEEVRSKRAFFCLGLQVRIRKAYQKPINYSLLWLVKYYLNNFSYYLYIRFESYVVLITKNSAKKLKN